MKRITAMKNVLKIQKRLRTNNVFQTPKCDYAAYEIRSVWLHGSVCTTKEDPSDIDLLFNGRPLGERRDIRHPDTVVDPTCTWWRFPRSADTQALMDLRKGMKMIRYDEFYPNKPWEDQALFHRIKASKLMIFPKCELDQWPLTKA